MRTPDRKRKAQQREREKSAGLARVEITVPNELLKELMAHLHPIKVDVKHELAGLLRLELPTHLQRLRDIARTGGSLWRTAEKYRPFASKLQGPGVHFTLRGVPYSSDEWHQVEGELDRLISALTRLGWPANRIKRYLQHAAANLQKRAKT